MTCLSVSGCPSRQGQRASRRTPRIAPPDSESERQADRIADAVISGHPVSLSAGGNSGGIIHRQCEACAAGAPCPDCATDQVLHLGRANGPSPVTSAAPKAAQALASGGQAMTAQMRSYFEPRFGADLSGIRLHTGVPEARDINARAYTMGRHIGFAPGAFDTESRDGQRLIAHEIVHALQGDGQLHREVGEEEDPEAAPTPPTTRHDTFEDTSGGGGTTFHEIVETAPVVAGDHIQGSVRRREEAPATDDEPQQDVSDMSAFVDFNTSTCEILLPYRFGFRLAADDPRGQSCEGEATEGNEDLDQIAQDYIDAVNGAMNNQFTIRLTDCENDCAGRDIPIRVSASRDDIDPDRTITVVSRSGRGDALTLCAGSFDMQFPVHEAGHQILGRGDEYPERDADILTAMPEWGRSERVRLDYPVLGSRHRYGRFAAFHERDFRHVQTFMRAAFPNCQAELRATRNVVLDYRIFATGGFGVLSGTPAGQVGLGFDVGFPLSRGREWSVLVGAQADFLSQLSEDRRQFVLAGMRLGFERQFHGATVSGRAFGGGRFGVSQEFGTEGASPGFGEPPVTHDPHTSAFGEVEAGGGVMVHTGGGGAFTADIRLRGGGELGGRDEAAYWFNAGLALGARF